MASSILHKVYLQDLTWSGKALRRGPYAMDLGLRLAFTWLETLPYTLASQQTFFTLALWAKISQIVTKS
jgi:hypothetical protein